MERTVRGRPGRLGLHRAACRFLIRSRCQRSTGVRAHQQPHPAKRLWPQPVQQRRQQSPVRRGEAHLLPAQLVSPAWFRAGDLPAQDRDLVPEHQDLRVLSGVIPRQENQPAEHPDHGQVDEADQHERRA